MKLNCFMVTVAAVGGMFAASGCVGVKPPKAGHAVFTAGGQNAPSRLEMVQPENPSTPSRMDYERNTETIFSPLPLTSSSSLPLPPQVPAASSRGSLPQIPAGMHPAAPTRVAGTWEAPFPSVPARPAQPLQGTYRTSERTSTTLGAAYKDDSREFLARVKALVPAQILGLILMLGALAMFHPGVYAVAGSRTLQAAAGVAGLMLAFSPAIVPGHERLLIALSLGGLLAWYVAHRHGELRGRTANDQRTSEQTPSSTDGGQSSKLQAPKKLQPPITSTTAPL